jgi:hypothetical protein
MATPSGLPFPSSSDSPDVAGDIEALAFAVDDNFYNKTESDDLYRTKSDSYTKGQVDAVTPTQLTGVAKLHFGKVSDTPGSQGRLTISHGAGFTPDAIVVTLQDTDTPLQANGGRVVNVIGGTIDGNTFQVSAFDNDNGAAVTGQITIHYICWTTE